MPYIGQSLLDEHICLQGAYFFSVQSNQAQALQVPMNKECKVPLNQIAVSKVKIIPVKLLCVNGLNTQNTCWSLHYDSNLSRRMPVCKESAVFLHVSSQYMFHRKYGFM